MKQKNLILMGVAVGCGLVAAVLTARMNAGPAPVEKVEVVVPAKDIPVGTMITKDDVSKLFTRKAFPKDGLPPNIVETVHIAFKDAMTDPRVAALLDSYIQAPWYKSPAEYRAFAETYFVEVKPLLIKAGVAKS